MSKREVGIQQQTDLWGARRCQGGTSGQEALLETSSSEVGHTSVLRTRLFEIARLTFSPPRRQQASRQGPL